jgi:hypothetical protein
MLTRAYNCLILWCLSQKYPGKAVTALEQLLEADPDSCYEENLLRQREWYRSPDLVKERNRYLFRAERRMYEGRGELERIKDSGHKTRLEELLERLHQRDDLPEDVKKPELYLRHHVLKGEL